MMDCVASSQSKDNTTTTVETDDNNSIPAKILKIEQALAEELSSKTYCFPVKYIYNPIDYAFEAHRQYLTNYCRTTKKILFLGMHAGSWGMCQTGVPFGEVNVVRDSMNISCEVGRPSPEHPKVKITGFNCERSEASGKKFWNLFKEICNQDLGRFFQHAFLYNYCPIALISGADRGRNITTAELKLEEKKVLQKACDKALGEVLKLLNVKIVVGIGRFAEKRAKTVIKENRLSMEVLFIHHPSPRSPYKKSWNELVKNQLVNNNLMHYFSN